MIQNPLFFIIGSTGVGKSKLALSLAIKHRGSILNCDSLQVYKNVLIGTNQPLAEDLKKVSHFLFNFVEERTQFTAGEYRNLALKVIEKEIIKGPMLCVGGSGFYVQALEKGMFKVKKIPESLIKGLQNEMKEKGKNSFYLEIQEKDPHYAESISPNDTYRILRAVAMMRSLGKKISDIKKNKMNQPLKYPFYKLGLFLEKEELKKKLQQRTKKMLQSGLIEETKSLMKKTPLHSHLLKSVGYKEVFEFIKGFISKEELEEKILSRNLKLVKKQITWFKRDNQIDWFHALKEKDKVFKWVKSKII